MKEKELVKIIKEDGKNLVSGRELHEKLKVKRDFTTWVKGRISKYNFTENEDFTVINLAHQNGGASWGGSNKVDYILTLDVAKEMCMVENNDVGRQIRRYFIRTEEEYRKCENSKILKRIEELEKQVRILSANPNNYKEFKSLTEWLKGYNIPTPEANKILVELGIMKKDKEGFHLSDYCPTTWGVPKPIQGVLRIYWSAIGFKEIIPKIQKKWDQKKLVSGQYEQAKMEI